MTAPPPSPGAGGAVTSLFAVDAACGSGDGAAPGAAAAAQRGTLYTRDTLASALCLMGAKPRHSLKVAARVFDALGLLARRAALEGGACPSGLRSLPHRLPRPVARTATFAGSAASLPRPHFEALVAWALAEYQYAKPDQVEDLRLACRRVRGAPAAGVPRLARRRAAKGADARRARAAAAGYTSGARQSLCCSAAQVAPASPRWRRSWCARGRLQRRSAPAAARAGA
jgi:hypothetical protein